jgi:nucleoside-diphosphate-sugar epimerase
VYAFLKESGLDVSGHFRAEEGDLDASAIARRPDVVVNCAGLLGGRGFQAEQLRTANTELPGGLARFCEAGNACLVHLSTPGVTGLRAGASEDDPPDPWGDYEASKAAGESALRAAGLPDGALTVLRPDFVYGPGDMHKLRLFRQIGKGWFPLVGNGGAMLRPTFVTDVCRAVEASLPGGILAGRTVNIGGDRVLSVRDLVGAIAGAMSVTARLVRIPRLLFRMALLAGPLKPEALSRSSYRLFGEDHWVSVARAEAAGFRPATGLDSGMAETVAWYREEGLL